MTTKTRIKICGVTTQRDALLAAECGADAIGLIFYPPSPRAVSMSVAREIALAVGPFVTVVGLFVDAAAERVAQVLQSIPLHALQFHGGESPEYCEQFSRPYVKTLKVARAIDGQTDEAAIEAVQRDFQAVQRDIVAQASQYSSAAGILLDTLSDTAQGGTGESFNWRSVPKSRECNWILAGGLNPANVGQAVRMARPYAVDVSSGVESSPGVKDSKKIRAFIDSIKAAN